MEDRIAALRAEIEAFIDLRVDHIKLSAPGIPDAVIRGMLTAKSGQCVCSAYLNVAEEMRKEAAPL